MSKTLNAEQKAAVEHISGPLLIIAGAGTGKTTVITERIKHLIETGAASSSEILALTFTEKAATEMEGRIDEALPLGQSSVFVSTFHGFCDRVLRQDGFHIGIDTGFRLMTTAESLDLLKKNIYDLGLEYFAPLGNPNKFLFGLLSHFSRLQDENITPDQYNEWVKNAFLQTEEDAARALEKKKYEELSRSYKMYEQLKIEKSLFDFGDLITKTILLFEKRPNVLAEYHKKFKYILVDEFQDTNFAQNKLTFLLAGKTGNITIVGDEDQSIYAFRGTSITNILRVRNLYPDVKIVTLTRNYRSKQNILDVAHLLISHNNPDRLEVLEKIDKRLIAEREGQAHIDFHHAESVTDEAEFVVQTILEKNKEGHLFSDFAILVRANAHADPFVRALENAQVPYQFLGPGKLFFEPEISDLVSYLRVIANPEDDTALYRVLSIPQFAIPPLILSKLMSHARAQYLSLFDVIQDLPFELTNEVQAQVTLLITLITDHIAQSQDVSSGVLLLDFLDKSGLRESLLSENSVEAVNSAQNIEKFFKKIKGFESIHASARIADIVAWIELQTEIGESPQASEIEWEGEDKVNILTVHGSKGLEFPIVFVVNLVALRFPSVSRREQIPIPDALIQDPLPETEFHLQEERRLFYVALTRAKDELYITGAKTYGEGKQQKKLSPFIQEAFPKVPAATDVPKKEKKEEQDMMNIQENTSKKKEHRVTTLSYSAIETFKTCPLHYKLRYLLKVPTKQTAAQSFGVSFHNAMKLLHEQLDTGEEVSLETILKTRWVSAGYTSKSHMKKAFDQGISFLQFYLDNWKKNVGQTLSLEEKFSFTLPQNLTITGAIDRIEKSSHGIHIIDYKTGTHVMSEKEAKESLQLSIYALAATNIKSEPFNKKPSEVTLSLFYFETGEIVSTTRTEKDLEKAVEEILIFRDQIENSDFVCNGNYFCQDCEYKQYCLPSLFST